jgi:hypothetical protein
VRTKTLPILRTVDIIMPYLPFTFVNSIVNFDFKVDFNVNRLNNCLSKIFK